MFVHVLEHVSWPTLNNVQVIYIDITVQYDGPEKKRFVSVIPGTPLHRPQSWSNFHDG